MSGQIRQYCTSEARRAGFVVHIAGYRITDFEHSQAMRCKPCRKLPDDIPVDCHPIVFRHEGQGRLPVPHIGHRPRQLIPCQIGRVGHNDIKTACDLRKAVPMGKMQIGTFPGPSPGVIRWFSRRSRSCPLRDGQKPPGIAPGPAEGLH